jgi:hypothetical protein
VEDNRTVGVRRDNNGEEVEVHFAAIGNDQTVDLVVVHETEEVVQDYKQI